jgi:hypothetical protein
MSLLAALLLGASPAPAKASAPEQGMLDAFKGACSNPEDFEGMKAAAKASGWEEIAEDAEPRIAALIRMGREAIGEEEPGGQEFGANYRRPFGARHIFLIVSRHVAAEGYWGNGCRVYDFDAKAALDPAALEAMVGKPPSGVQDFGDGLKNLLWEPGFRDGMSIEAKHVPADHAVGKSFGVTGNILLSQAIGGFEKLFSPPDETPQPPEDEPDAPSDGDKR